MDLSTAYTVGIDFGTLSGRALVVRVADGAELGAAIQAAVAAGAYQDVRAAAAAMGRVERGTHQPNEAAAEVYDQLFAEYTTLHDYFGRGANPVMRKLRSIQRESLNR